MPIALKRAYEKATPNDGHRILVDRIWPRGVSKDALDLDEWMKEVAPSDQLRKSFHKGDLTWGQFRNDYLSELKSHRNELRRLAQTSQQSQVTLVFSAQDRKHNNAVVLMQYLNLLGRADKANSRYDSQSPTDS
jgi:uncharacterized protein YeaO (DUF488 family)